MIYSPVLKKRGLKTVYYGSSISLISLLQCDNSCIYGALEIKNYRYLLNIRRNSGGQFCQDFVFKSQDISNKDFIAILCMPFFSCQEAVFLQTDNLENHVTVSFCAC